MKGVVGQSINSFFAFELDAFSWRGPAGRVARIMSGFAAGVSRRPGTIFPRMSPPPSTCGARQMPAHALPLPAAAALLQGSPSRVPTRSRGRARRTARRRRAPRRRLARRAGASAVARRRRRQRRRRAPPHVVAPTERGGGVRRARVGGCTRTAEQGVLVGGIVAVVDAAALCARASTWRPASSTAGTLAANASLAWRPDRPAPAQAAASWARRSFSGQTAQGKKGARTFGAPLKCGELASGSAVFDAVDGGGGGRSTPAGHERQRRVERGRRRRIHAAAPRRSGGPAGTVAARASGLGVRPRSISAGVPHPAHASSADSEKRETGHLWSWGDEGGSAAMQHAGALGISEHDSIS